MDRSRLKILVVNDKGELRSIIRQYLREAGYTQLQLSENGLSAFKKAQLDPPDLIVADYTLPGMNGLELLKAVRRDPKIQDTPFLLISSETEQKYVALAAEFRVDGYVVKPFSQQTLMDKVNRLLEKHLNPSEVDRVYRQANQLARDGDLDAALEAYRLALDATKHSVAAVHYKIGRVEETLGREDDAAGNYQAAVDMSRLYADAYDALGTLKLNHDEADGALQCFRRSSDISPFNAERQRKLGEALLETGDFEAAEKAFKLALHLDPSQTNVFNRLGISLRRQGKLDEALRWFLRALDVSDQDENLLYNLSRVYFDQGDRTSALNYLHQALALNPDFTEAREMADEIRTA